MKEFIKKFAVLLVFYILILICEYWYDIQDMISEVNPFDYARITDVDYKAKVIDESSDNERVNITERLTFDVRAASKNNLFWELWRDLVESEVDGLYVSYNVNSVKQILADGTEVPYTESSKLYWYDSDYVSSEYGPGKWYHSKGPYNPANRRYECLLFYVDGLYREKVTFEINYDMYNAVLRYKDSSELYLSLYSGNTIKYLDSFKAQILIPDEKMPQSGNYTAHTYGTNSNNFKFTESATLNPGYYTFSFNLDESQLKFKPYNQYIEFTLVSYGNDAHIFSKYAKKNIYTVNNVLDEIESEQKEYDALPVRYMVYKLIVFMLCLGASFIIILKLLKADDKVESKYHFYKPTIKMDYFRDIPSNLDPTLAATLVFCKHKKLKDYTNVYSAILLSLVRKKYIEITKINENKDWNDKNININITAGKYSSNQIHYNFTETQTETSSNLEPLTKTEEYYFNLILRHSRNQSITMKDFQSKVASDYENTNDFVKNIENSATDIGISQGYFQRTNYDMPKKQLKLKSILCAIIGILILTVVNYKSYQTRLDLAYGGFFLLGSSFIFGAFIYHYLSKQYVLLTQFGEDEYVKWRGLYNFLNSETLMNERTVIELPIWEQYLVYATAFGISDKVVKALKIRCPDANMETASPILYNSYFHSMHFHSSCHSFRTATSHASSIATAGTYGGYGGGGRGGGGGRRRTLIL